MRLPIPAFVILAAALAAAAAPSLLVYNVAPSPTFLNQALACALWGAFVVVCVPHQQQPGRGTAPVALALAVMAGAVLWSWALRGLPASLALSALGLLAACALLLLAGNAAGRSRDREAVFALFCWAWVGAGLLNLVVAGVQVFAPGLADGHWIAIPNIAGRAMGNLRQPNHLSSLLMWASVAAVGLLLLRRLALGWAAVLLAAMVFGVVLTASRTGSLSVALLALWGLLDRRLAKPARWLLLSTPLMYALAWWGLSQWAALSHAAFGGEQRLAEADISGSRFGIWANTWTLITQQPWAGVGFGNFNLAWTLTPFPGRPVAFFDHSHNLLLQWAAELGLPVATLLLALLLWAVVRGWQRALRHDGQGDHNFSAAQRCAMVMVLMIGLHSLLEYPLWYAYFLLPAGWAFGYAVTDLKRADFKSTQHISNHAAVAELPFSPAGWALAGAAALLVLGAVAAVADYRRVAVIYTARAQSSPLPERIAAGQHSVLFAHHADYAAVTSGTHPGRVDPAFDRVSHYLLDTRLMMAWADALAAQGDTDLARQLAARLREFRKPDAKEFFAACPESAKPIAAATAAAAPYACEQPTTVVGWSRYLKTAR